MPNKLHEMEALLRDVYEGLSEKGLISRSRHKRLEHWILLVRNIAVALAVILFLISLVHTAQSSACKAAAYFLGAGAYFCEILILTDCFQTKVPHREMFMAYCFGPLYILLGISYLTGH